MKISIEEILDIPEWQEAKMLLENKTDKELTVSVVFNNPYLYQLFIFGNTVRVLMKEFEDIAWDVVFEEKLSGKNYKEACKMLTEEFIKEKTWKAL